LCRYIYNPADLAAVAQGNKDPWEVQPAQYKNITYLASVGRVLVDTPTGQLRRVTGAAYDSKNQTLYLLYAHSGREIPEDYDKPFHLVQVFQLGRGSERRRAAAATAMQSDGGDIGVQAEAAPELSDDVLAQLQQLQQQQELQAVARHADTPAAQPPLKLKRRLL
jgi:hypothetical protein